MYVRGALSNERPYRDPGHDHLGSYRALVEEAQVDQVIDCLAPEVCGCSEPMKPRVYGLFSVQATMPPAKLAGRHRTSSSIDHAS